MASGIVSWVKGYVGRGSGSSQSLYLGSFVRPASSVSASERLTGSRDDENQFSSYRFCAKVHPSFAGEEDNQCAWEIFQLSLYIDLPCNHLNWLEAVKKGPTEKIAPDRMTGKHVNQPRQSRPSRFSAGRYRGGGGSRFDWKRLKAKAQMWPERKKLRKRRCGRIGRSLDIDPGRAPGKRCLRCVRQICLAITASLPSSQLGRGLAA
jgi:hypothetical protein